MSSALTSFIHGSENTPPASTSSNPTTSTATQSGNSAERILTMPTNSVSISQNKENFLFPNGVNPQSAIREFPRMLIHFQHQYEQVNGLNSSLLRDFKLLVLVAAFLLWGLPLCKFNDYWVRTSEASENNYWTCHLSSDWSCMLMCKTLAERM